MKTFFTIIIILFTSAASAQNLKKKTVNNDETGIVEKFTVLRENEEIKQGKYELYRIHDPLILLCTGFYKNNLKDSLWTYYARNGSAIASGSYKDGLKIGIWYGIGTDKNVEVKYDYTNKKLIFYSPKHLDTIKEYYVIKGTDTVYTKLSQEPIFLGGSALVNQSLYSTIKFPVSAFLHHIQGRVVVAFTINDKGIMSNYRVKYGLGYGCDEEALKNVKNIQGDWLPGMLDGKPITCEYMLSIAFKVGS